MRSTGTDYERGEHPQPPECDVFFSIGYSRKNRFKTEAERMKKKGKETCINIKRKSGPAQAFLLGWGKELRKEAGSRIVRKASKIRLSVVAVVLFERTRTFSRIWRVGSKKQGRVGLTGEKKTVSRALGGWRHRGKRLSKNAAICGKDENKRGGGKPTTHVSSQTTTQ